MDDRLVRTLYMKSYLNRCILWKRDFGKKRTTGKVVSRGKVKHTSKLMCIRSVVN